MVGRSRATRFKDNAANTAEFALQLAQDERFRKRLLSGIEHAAKAGRLAKQNLGLMGAVARLTTDQALLRELQSARRDLEQARGRVEKKRAGRKLRNFILFGSLVSLAAVPQLRKRLIEAIREGFRQLRSTLAKVSSSTGDRVSPGPRQLEEMTRDELYALAQEADVPGRSEMSKDQLLEALRSRS
jgi:hypothetical protein